MGDNGEEQRRRLEFARLKAAYYAGKGSVSTSELTDLAIREGGHKKVGATYAGRIENGERPVMLDWATALGKVARVSPSWLLMLPDAEAPADYAEWLARRLAEEEAEKARRGKGAPYAHKPERAKRPDEKGKGAKGKRAS